MSDVILGTNSSNYKISIVKKKDGSYKLKFKEYGSNKTYKHKFTPEV